MLQESVEFNNNSTRGMEITFKVSKLTGMVNLKPTMYSYQWLWKNLSATPSSRGQFLFYKVPQETVDFDDVSTRMSIRAMEITLNASILAGMVNLKPIIRFSDCEEK